MPQMAGQDFDTFGVFVQPVMGDFDTDDGQGRDCAIHWPSFCHVGLGSRWQPFMAAYQACNRWWCIVGFIFFCLFFSLSSAHNCTLHSLTSTFCLFI